MSKEREEIKFEILRDRDRRPTVTICTISVNGCTGIGRSIRSLKDNPVERRGKAKAFGRAKKALFRRETSLPICRAEAFEAISTTSAFMDMGIPAYKSIYQEV